MGCSVALADQENKASNEKVVLIMRVVREHVVSRRACQRQARLVVGKFLLSS